VKLNRFLEAMERIAPRALALEFDNPGLLVEPDHDEINRVLVALDCSIAVAKEAAEWGADLVLTHHPLFFHPVSRMAYSSPETAAACLLLRNGIGLFAAHTNLDAATGGVNDSLCALLGIRDAIPFDEGVGRIGTLKTPVDGRTFQLDAERLLSTQAQFVGDPDKPVSRVAVMGGSGGSSILPAKELGADLLLTGELKHSDAIAAKTIGLNVIVAGHYETERVVLLPLIQRLQEAGFPVQYQVSRADVSPFVRL
jgi:dinuclear metal center YbgI/SA1388 family protein